MRRTERERLARKRELERFAGLKMLTAEEVRDKPGLRKLAGWCAEVERSHFDRSKYEIVECDDGPYALCHECAVMIRAQLAELHAKGRLPNA